jgi:7-cyano-7-deazaguanine synthase in queuosine biosynthesis
VSPFADSSPCPAFLALTRAYNSGYFSAIGVTLAVIGWIQATEIIKYIVGVGGLLSDRLSIYDRLKFNPHCEHCARVGKGQDKK